MFEVGKHRVKNSDIEAHVDAIVNKASGTTLLIGHVVIGSIVHTAMWSKSGNFMPSYSSKSLPPSYNYSLDLLPPVSKGEDQFNRLTPRNQEIIKAMILAGADYSIVQAAARAMPCTFSNEQVDALMSYVRSL